MAENGVVFDHNDILNILPHRYPFLMVDKVIEFEDAKRIVTIKNVTFNEHFFSGHFPGKPVMPGVMILEAMAQTGAIFAKKSFNGLAMDKLFYFVGANDIKWKKPVFPGDILRIEMMADKVRRPLWMMKGTVHVGDKLVAQGSLSAAEGV
ncbi:MAG: 3-hydroxyacyl-ACP dehydratase FabZ [bacterium]|nr:3-hydroxyacyl-ACP dehydratase FabZ [bacterium]